VSAANVKVQLDGGGRGTITVDGHELAHAVNGVKVVSRAGHPSTVELSLVVGQLLTANLASDVQLDIDTLALLERLGWTPPGGAS
jgi:hypothetical protein